MQRRHKEILNVVSHFWKQTLQPKRLSEPSSWTLESFKRDISLGNTERLCQLTTGSSGYHGPFTATAHTTASMQVCNWQSHALPLLT
jgi:hypothetical protein